MRNPFENWGRGRSNADKQPENENEAELPVDPDEAMVEHEHREGWLTKLQEMSPRAEKLFYNLETLENEGRLTDEEFQKEIDAYNNAHQGEAPAEGEHESFTLPIGKRQFTAILYADGRVRIEGKV